MLLLLLLCSMRGARPSYELEFKYSRWGCSGGAGEEAVCLLLVAGLSGLDRFPPRLENTIDPPTFLRYAPSPLRPPLSCPPARATSLFFSFLSPWLPSIAFRRIDREVLDGSTTAIRRLYVTWPNPGPRKERERERESGR